MIACVVIYFTVYFVYSFDVCLTVGGQGVGRQYALTCVVDVSVVLSAEHLYSTFFVYAL